MKGFKTTLSQIILFMGLFFIIGSGCHRKSGCPAEGQHPKLDKKGNPKGKASSGLFDKKGRMNSR
ncbi:MAG TPA: hypothetical protein PK006_10455 [Saprospiraceae bacterium]|nr:hypothetical protein [Saprospiraceae bacterium]